MKRLRFEYETKLEFSYSVTEHSFTLRCIPFSDGRQVIAEPLCQIFPESGSIWRSRDSFGNILICGRMNEPHKEFSFKVSGEAQTANSCGGSGTAAAFYGFHTPLTFPGEKIRRGIVKTNVSSGYVTEIISESRLIQIHSPSAGICRSYVRTGDELHSGDLLCEIIDPLEGEVISKIFSPVNGIVFFRYNRPLEFEKSVLYKIIKT